MTNLWYNNTSVLFNDIDQVFPYKNLNKNQKINSIARFAIYYTVIIILTNKDKKYLQISIILLIISYMMEPMESFENFKESDEKEECYKPTEQNPFMNFTIADHYNNPNRPKNCNIKDVGDMMRKQFNKRVVPDPNNLWGQNISDRNFYTMPVTTIINDSVEFGNLLYGNGGKCKSEGVNCLNRALTRTSTGMFGSPI